MFVSHWLKLVLFVPKKKFWVAFEYKICSICTWYPAIRSYQMWVEVSHQKSSQWTKEG